MTRFKRLNLIARERVAPIALQLGVLLVVLQAYSFFRKTFFVPSPTSAFDNAHRLIEAQEMLGLAVHRIELPLQQWMLDRPWMIDLFNGYYQYFKPALLAGAMLCLALTPVDYRRVRTQFLVATLIALPWYAIFPLAPPRYMNQYGYPFVDTLAVYGGVESSAAGIGGANQFAAMPSMHIGWTVFAALWMAAAVPRWRIGAVIGGLHLALLSIAVMATGNHYFLDIVAGYVVASLAVIVTPWLSRVLSRDRHQSNAQWLSQARWTGSLGNQLRRTRSRRPSD